MSSVSSIYPVARRDTLSEDYHGHSVSDPYRWLENPDDAQVKEWLAQQQALTTNELNQYQETRDAIKTRLEKLYNYPRFSCPFVKGHQQNAQWYFFFKNDGLQNQSVLYKQFGTIDSKEEVLLDPNLIEADGTASLSALATTEDGEYLAYGVARSGSDWQTIYVLKVANGEKLVDEVEWVKFSSISWTHDNKGFFYARYPTPKKYLPPEEQAALDAQVDKDFKRGTETEGLLYHTVFYHRLGTSQKEDIQVFAVPTHAKHNVGAEVSEDGLYVLLSVHQSCDSVNRLLYFKLNPQNKSFEPTLLPSPKWSPFAAHSLAKLDIYRLVNKFEAEFSYITNEGTVFYFKTNKDKASKYKIVKIDIAQQEASRPDLLLPSLDTDEDNEPNVQHTPAPQDWIDVIPESKNVMNTVTVINHHYLLVVYMIDVKEEIFLFDMNDGKLIKENLPLPDLGSISGISARKCDDFFFYSFTSFLYPGNIYHAKLVATGDSVECETKVFREFSVPDFDASQYHTEQVFYPSKDGTKIPMFIVARKDMKKDGSNPVWLYGYGGFNISLNPSFSVARLIWLQNFGGIMAIPNIRGGGEYGEEWWYNGRCFKKQNVFDDFQYAAKYLISAQYSSASKIAINGGSNGGLLVGACINQAPELFGCAVAAVGVFDMLRFHKFTIGHAWSSDYGCSDNKEDFEYLLTYSPIHNVRTEEDVIYPATMLTSAEFDDRVPVLHTYKFLATLQHVVGQKSKQVAPLIARIESKAGHGAGMPLSKRIIEQADVMAFMAHHLKAKGNF